jgi:hypothetical protein
MAVAPSLSLRPAGPTRAPQPGDPATEIVPGCRPGGLDRDHHHDRVPVDHHSDVAQRVNHRFLQPARFSAQDKSMSHYSRNT